MLCNPGIWISIDIEQGHVTSLQKDIFEHLIVDRIKAYCFSILKKLLPDFLNGKMG